MVVKEKLKPPSGPFVVAIKGLRSSLELSQEEAAHRVGVTLGAWRSWEQGVNSPRRRQLEKIATLPADAKIRVKFWLDICLDGIRLSSVLSGSGKMLREDRELIISANSAVEAVKQLVLAAARGSHAAREELKSLAGRLRQAARKYSTSPKSRLGSERRAQAP
jgi:transcriptional regulator with XRE-family HTH domain